MSYEKTIMPKQFQIQGNVKSGLWCEFLDCELDPIRVEFHYDNAVTIITEGNTYIKISLEQLEILSCLVEEADEMYEEEL